MKVKDVSLKRINNAYKITFKLINVTAFRIGASEETLDPTTPDNSVMRSYKDGNLVPFIPGSTLKGLFRAAVQSIDETYDKCGWHDKKASMESKKEFIKLFEEPNNDINLCRTCKLFGNNFIEGRLFFTDSYAEGETKISIRDGVEIDRETETAKDKAKYDYEVIEPGAVFPVEITAINVDEEDLKLIREVINLINLGIVRIGGSKSRGLGKFMVKDYKEEKIKGSDVNV